MRTKLDDVNRRNGIPRFNRLISFLSATTYPADCAVADFVRENPDTEFPFLSEYISSLVYLSTAIFAYFWCNYTNHLFLGSEYCVIKEGHEMYQLFLTWINCMNLLELELCPTPLCNPDRLTKQPYKTTYKL